MADLSTEIETSAQEPKRMRVDGNEVEQHSLTDQIEADRYLASKAAASSAKRGFTIAKFKPSGSI